MRILAQLIREYHLALDQPEKDTIYSEIYKLLNNPDTDLNEKNMETGSIQNTPLHEAIMYRLEDVIDKLLLDERVDVNIKNDLGYSPLDSTVIREDDNYSSNICRKLLERGAFLEVEKWIDNTYYCSPLHSMLYKNKDALFYAPKTWKLLLEHGAFSVQEDCKKLPKDLQKLANTNRKYAEFCGLGKKAINSSKVEALLFKYTHPLSFFKKSTKASRIFSGKWRHHNIGRAGSIIKELKLHPLDGKALRKYLSKERDEALTKGHANKDGDFIHSISFLIGNIR